MLDNRNSLCGLLAIFLKISVIADISFAACPGDLYQSMNTYASCTTPGIACNVRRYSTSRLCSISECELTEYYAFEVTPDVPQDSPGWQYYHVEYCSKSSAVENPMPSNSCLNVKKTSHSYINMESKSIVERIPLVGINTDLYYDSSSYQISGYNSPARGFELGGWMLGLVHRYDMAYQTLHFGYGGRRLVSPVYDYASASFKIASLSGDEIYFFDSNGVHLRTLDGLTNSLKYTFTYVSNRKLLKIEDAFLNATTFTYPPGQVVITSPYNKITTLNLDANSLLASVVNPNNESYLVTMDNYGQMTEFTTPESQKSVVTYDDLGYVRKDTGAGGDFLSIIHSYDSVTKLQNVSVSTASGRTTNITSKKNGTSYEVTNTDPSGYSYTNNNVDNTSSSSANSFGVQYSAILEPDPRFGSMSPFANSTTSTISGSPINFTTQTTKIFINSILTTTVTLQNDSTRIYTSTYDAATGVYTHLSPLNRTITAVNNASGQIGNLQVGTLEPFAFSYDSRGRLTQVNQQNRQMLFTYDLNGNLYTTQDPLGKITTYNYDSANRLTKITFPTGKFVSATYNMNGQLATLTPPEKSVHGFTTNLMELVSGYQPPVLETSPVSTAYEYNLDQQLTKITRPDGQVVTFTYDTTKGLLNNINIPTGNIVFTYHPNSDLIYQVTSPDLITTEYQYFGYLPKLVKNTGSVASYIKYNYNPDATIASIVAAGANNIEDSIALGYDKDSLITQVGNQNIVRNSVGDIDAATLDKVTEERLYDNFGQITQSKFTSLVSGVTTNLLFLDYVRDGLGRIMGIKENNSTTQRNYEFDDQGRLYRVLDNTTLLRQYNYDANGNRIGKTVGSTSTVGTYDNQDRLTHWGTTAYTYSLNGELATKTEAGNSITSYVYDVNSNLLKVTLPTANVIEYLIDGQNRRVAKLVNGTKTLGFIYQSQTQIAAQTNSTGNIVKRFIYGTKTNVPDYMIYNSKEYRIITDHIGSPRKIVDASTGVVVESLSYDEFGLPSNGAGSTYVPFGFAGGLWDEDTGLLRFGARDYDPTIGRWTSKDPIGFNGGDTNLYGYTWNDPVNFIDPIGLWGIGVIGGGSAEGGVGNVGGGATGSAGAGAFCGGNEGVNAGAFASGGAFIGGNGVPSGGSNNMAVGGFAGVGGGIFLTNATNVSQLGGQSNTYSFNLGVGPFKFSAQLSSGGGVWIGSITLGPGIGISGSTYPTYTGTTGKK